MLLFKKRIKKHLAKKKSTIIIRDYKISDGTVMRLVDNDGIRHRYSYSLRMVDENGQMIGVSDIENIKKDFYDALVKTHENDLIAEETYLL